jgi:hypothetical protein
VREIPCRLSSLLSPHDGARQVEDLDRSVTKIPRLDEAAFPTSALARGCLPHLLQCREDCEFVGRKRQNS